MQVSRDYSAYFVWAGSLWLPSSFPRRKGGAGFSLLVGPAACTVCPEHPRSPSACSARCPNFWLAVVHNAEFPRPGADRFIRPWAQGVSPGAAGRPNGIIRAASGTAARDGWCMPQRQGPAAGLPSLFSVKKTAEAPGPQKTTQRPPQTRKGAVLCVFRMPCPPGDTR